MSSITKANVGDWQWLEETGGKLTSQQRRSMVPALAVTFGQFFADHFRLAIGRRPIGSHSADDLWPTAPDSVFARRSEEAARELQTLPVVHHAFRTWIFGHALAKIDEMNLDTEVFHAGSMMHDVGLEHPVAGQCFTRRSAEAAREVAQTLDFDATRTREMMDGIVAHITPGLQREQTLPGFYLQAGATADLLGLRLWQLPKDLVARANEQYPRNDVHKVLSKCWRAEAATVPGGRAHFAQAFGGFGHIVRWLGTR